MSQRTATEIELAYLELGRSWWACLRLCDEWRSVHGRQPSLPPVSASITDFEASKVLYRDYWCALKQVDDMKQVADRSYDFWKGEVAALEAAMAKRAEVA